LSVQGFTRTRVRIARSIADDAMSIGDIVSPGLLCRTPIDIILVKILYIDDHKI
jgi:hypothetical protein